MTGSVAIVDYVSGQPLSPLPVSGTITAINSAPSALVVKQAVATNSGSTTVWTPAAGKRVRILAVAVHILNGSTSAAGIDVSLQDGGANIWYLCKVGATNIDRYNYTLLPLGGYLSAAADNLIRVNLSAAFTVSGMYVTIWGYEE